MTRFFPSGGIEEESDQGYEGEACSVMIGSVINFEQAKTLFKKRYRKLRNQRKPNRQCKH